MHILLILFIVTIIYPHQSDGSGIQEKKHYNNYHISSEDEDERYNDHILEDQEGQFVDYKKITYSDNGLHLHANKQLGHGVSSLPIDIDGYKFMNHRNDGPVKFRHQNKAEDLNMEEELEVFRILDNVAGHLFTNDRLGHKKRMKSNYLSSGDFENENNIKDFGDGDFKIYIILIDQDDDSVENKWHGLKNNRPFGVSKKYKTKSKHSNNKSFQLKRDLWSRRISRDSREYAPKSRDSMEDDYRPKRQRSEFGGGRTAMPYGRNRGDIYEKTK